MTRFVLGMGLLASSTARAQQVVLRPPSAAGRPGEVVSLEFRANVPVALGHYLITFRLPPEAGDFIRTETAGTAAAGIEPRAVFYRVDAATGRLFTGAYPRQSPNLRRVAPGQDIVLVKAIIRIRPDAPLGEHPVTILSSGLGATAIADERSRSLEYSVDVSRPGVLRVEAPDGPRPIGDLACAQEGEGVQLSWKVSEAYDGISVRRGANVVASLAGSATSYLDRPPLGPVAYEVIAERAGKAAIAAACQTILEAPRPAPVRNLGCEIRAGAVALAWENGAAYAGIQVFKNGAVRTELAGDAVGFSDNEVPELFTVYSVRGRDAGGAESIAVSCKLHEFSNVYVLRADEVRAEPGQTAIEIPIFATNPGLIHGFSTAFRIDPARAQIREVRMSGTRTEEFQPTFFGYDLIGERGEVTAGVVFDFLGGTGYPPAAEQHVLTIAVDLAGDAPLGSQIPVEFGSFGSPPGKNAFTIPPSQTAIATTIDGSLLVGSSPVPEVQGALAEEVAPQPPAAGLRKGLADSRAIRLSWTNPVLYDSITVERNGETIATLGGEADTHLDSSNAPGLRRYRIQAQKGGLKAFPVAVLALPSGVPGTFLRGDGNGDGKVAIQDAFLALRFIFIGGFQPPCLDALDADDSGSLGLHDPLTLLFYLFLGTRQLPAPGTRFPWLDPTDDALSCGA